MDKQLPGTNKTYTGELPFEEFKKFIQATDGISLAQVCSISSLEPGTIQNWVKRGYVARPIKKKYYEKQVARILLINSLREAMKIEDIGKLMILINGDVEDESDDLLKEEELYTIFAKIIYYLDDDVSKTIKQVLKKEKINNKKLYLALETMVNAYIAGNHIKKSRKYLEELINC